MSAVARRVLRWFAICIACASSSAYAHKPSDAYLNLTVSGAHVTGQWDIALRDLDRALALDVNGDGVLVWAELSQREQILREYARARLVLQAGKHVCELDIQPISLVEHSDGPYARLPFRASCGQDSTKLSLNYEFLFDLDTQHRAVVRVARAGSEQTFVLSHARRTLLLSREPAQDGSPAAMVLDGVRHILGGLDHVLFLFALLLPVVLRPELESGTRVAQMGAALRDIFKVVTAFTVAHSLTLALAGLGIASVSAHIIEPAIAASVTIAALDNLRPTFGQDRWSVAFVLGLLHGFGFSSALSDGGVSTAGLVRSLFAFNVGVELGQLAIVLLFVPIAFLLRRAWFYQFVVMRGGSLAIALLSLAWLWERIGEG